MIYAQIKSGIVQNTLVLDDESKASVFSAGFDVFLRIDDLSPVPGIGWAHDGQNFTPPENPSPEE